MTFYQRISTVGIKLFGLKNMVKWGFNLTPMYRRTTARIISVSEDIHYIKMRLPKSYKNVNYVGSIFGGSMFSAVDPIPMMQLINILGGDYVVWDKGAQIAFKRPGRCTLYGEFIFTKEEIEFIKKEVKEKKEITFDKLTQLQNKEKSFVFCEVIKTIYIADKEFYKQKMELRKLGKSC